MSVKEISEIFRSHGFDPDWIIHWTDIDNNPRLQDAFRDVSKFDIIDVADFISYNLNERIRHVISSHNDEINRFGNSRWQLKDHLKFIRHMQKHSYIYALKWFNENILSI